MCFLSLSLEVEEERVILLIDFVFVRVRGERKRNYATSARESGVGFEDWDMNGMKTMIHRQRGLFAKLDVHFGLLLHFFYLRFMI